MPRTGAGTTSASSRLASTFTMPDVSQRPRDWKEKGFELVRHDTAVRDFTDQDAALPLYQPEIERLSAS